MTSDPEFQISGVVIGGAIGVVTLRWVNLGQFVSQAWSSGVLLAKMAGWSSVREHQSICADNITFDESLPGLSVASAAGSNISWRTSGTVEVGANMWHEAQLVFPVSKS